MSRIEILTIAVVVIGTLQIVGAVLMISWSRHLIDVTKSHQSFVKDLIK